MDLQQRITAAFAGDLDPQAGWEATREAVELLDKGHARVAEKIDGEWVVHQWLKQAVLLWFRYSKMETMELAPFEFHDKVPLKTGLAEQGVRLVPPGAVRYGAHLERGVVCMPGYVNIAPMWAQAPWWTPGPRWAAARRSAAACTSPWRGHRGVLEPLGARPVIIEDGAFIGSRSIVVEGVVVEEEAVLGAGVTLTSSTQIIDVTGPEEVIVKAACPPAPCHPWNAHQVLPSRRLRGALRLDHRKAQGVDR